MSSAARKIQTAPLTILPLTPTIGAEIGDIDLRRPLDDAAKAALRQALLDWKVLFFRDQDITTEQHLAFAGAFGDLEVHPFAQRDFQKPVSPTTRQARGANCRQAVGRRHAHIHPAAVMQTCNPTAKRR